MRRAKRTGGFTLLELMMVVIILAILAAIALPQYLRTSDRARAAEALTVLSAIKSSQVRSRALTQAYAANLGTLDIVVPGFGNVPLGAAGWAYTTAGSVGTATLGTNHVYTNYDNGKVCSDHADYGLPANTGADCP